MNIEIELKRIKMPEPSEEHIQKTIELCRAVYFARRHMRPMSTPQMILEQLRFIAKPIWALQALVMLVMCFVIHRTLLTQDALNISRSLSLSAVFTAMTILPFCGRARKYNMMEIESATRLSNTRLVLAKLCTVGLGDAVCLIAFTFLTVGKTAEPLRAVLGFIVIPFLLTSLTGLFVLNRIKEEYGAAASTVLSLNISLIYWLAIPHIRIFAVPAAAVACAFLLLALFFECRRLLRQAPIAEAQDSLMY